MTSVNQNTLQRSRRTGLTALDEERACPGYVFFTTSGGNGETYLIDTEGREVRKWDMPYPSGSYNYILPNGNIFYTGKMESTFNPFPLWGNFRGGMLLEMDWDGNVLWEHQEEMHHHDARRTGSGGALIMGMEKVPEDIAARVKGGVPGSGEDVMWADELIEVDASGNRVWEWHANEHLDIETDEILFCDPRDYWTHGNSIAPLPDDKVLVSFRSISTVGIIDKKTGNFDWKLGYDVLAQQHDPNMLPNGNILIFDNGTHRKNTSMTSSRVIEVDPKTNEIVWEYSDRPLYTFFSPFTSSARRLPNGNTLITEGFFGRIFQVTPEGEVVWEYINPHFPEDAMGPSNRIFRATHYTKEELPHL